MGARVYTQKFRCANEFFVVNVVNDTVIPIESCQDGPSFPSPEERFYEYADAKMKDLNFVKACNVTSFSNVTELTYYWDCSTRKYNATLLDE